MSREETDAVLALIIVLLAVTGLLTVLVAGLLRSHADILRSLHALGAGVGDPALAPGVGDSALAPGVADPARRASVTRQSTPLIAGAQTIAGITPHGDAIALPVGSDGGHTLLAFLSSGCSTCRAFWSAFATGSPPVADGVRVVVVTRGVEAEAPEGVSGLCGAAMVVMSTDAWSDYGIHGSPFFVLVDGTTGRRLGEGVANQVEQLADLLRRSGTSTGLGGPARERMNDDVLLAAGIAPGDPSLYPRSVTDLYGRSAWPR